MKNLGKCAWAPVFALGLAATFIPPAQAAKYSVLYAFNGNAGGDEPIAGVIRDSAGNLYGTTRGGGASRVGTVYEIGTNQTQTTLYSFLGGPPGYQPYGTPIADKAGNLFGTASDGGNGGVVFRLAPDGTETTLHTFDGGSDGIGPLAGLVMDKTGGLYGTTEFGGTNNSGTVFKVAPSGAESVLYSFKTTNDGAYPLGSLIMDKKGNFYGTTSVGGSGYGTVFKLAPNGKETVLYAFKGGNDGATPYAGLIADKSGILYGTTSVGGKGNGTVFKLAPDGKETVLYAFKGGNDGASPYATLTTDKAGNFYGTTYSGSASGLGTVFTVSPSGKEQVLHAFQGGNDGANPTAGLIADTAGNFYGTTLFGGSSGCAGAGCGTVFTLRK